MPALTADWELQHAGRAWLTMSVQIGFVAGAFGSALLAALATALIPPLATGLALLMRFLTGLFFA